MAYKLKNLSVLIVDRNAPVRMLMRSVFLDLGFGTVHVAQDRETAWQLYRSDKPDIVMMDWHMDDDDGLALVRRIRTDRLSHNPSVPIIVMTGYTNKSRVLEARDKGVTEILVKPFSMEVLVGHIEHLIEKPRDFVVARGFTGPDRRRRRDETEEAYKKRYMDDPIMIPNHIRYFDSKGNVFNPFTIPEMQ